MSDLLNPNTIRAPDFGPGVWLNTEAPLTRDRLRGEPLAPGIAGGDVNLRSDDTSVVRVTRPRMYELVHNGEFAKHELELVFRANGLAIFAFTFTSCVAPQATTDERGTFISR